MTCFRLRTFVGTAIIRAGVWFLPPSPPTPTPLASVPLPDPPAFVACHGPLVATIPCPGAFLYAPRSTQAEIDAVGQRRETLYRVDQLEPRT
jgi:hypothetical protein